MRVDRNTRFKNIEILRNTSTWEIMQLQEDKIGGKKFIKGANWHKGSYIHIVSCRSSLELLPAVMGSGTHGLTENLVWLDRLYF